jgi:hypothetical protein
MKRTWVLVAITALALACSDAGGVDSDAIASPEKAAVQRSLDSALANDSLYPTLALLVFPYIDRAAHIVVGSDTMRVVNIELDIDATQDTNHTVAKISAVLAWRGFDATLHTVDTVLFVVGAGITAPALAVSDSIRSRFSPDTAGTATAFVIHQAADSSYQVWLARTGHVQTDSARYGGGQSQSGGGVTLTVYRGTGYGTFHLGAKSVPDSTTSSTNAAASYVSGARALKIKIRGTLP